MSKILSEDGKDQLALALILLKDFKSESKFDPDLVKMIYDLADHIGVRSNLDKLFAKIPPMKISPRDQQ